MQSYDHKTIEIKWEQEWEKNSLYRARAKTTDDMQKIYILDMFPYPSGAGLHVGHPRGYTATDILARYYRMRGYQVLHPMGWDAFGLPAEQYAIKTNIHPAESTRTNIDNFRRQLKRLGFSYDWDREIDTTDPSYYRWTQWIFLQLFHKGLAYEAETPVNWCPQLGTILANEEIIDGKSERGGYPVYRVPVRQWLLKITAYADRLVDDLQLLPEWPHKIRTMQENWIGRSIGATISYAIVGHNVNIHVFTTRPETNFGASFIAVAPDAPWTHEHMALFPNRQACEEYCLKTQQKSERDRIAQDREKTGAMTGLFAHNPLNNTKLPIYLSDFVLGSVGTGALVGVPGHDARDFDFACTFGLPITRVVKKNATDKDTPIKAAADVYEDHGVVINSGFLDGLSTDIAQKKIIAYLEKHSIGKRTVHYKLRDWVFSRQRYWGEPIPIVYEVDTAGKRISGPIALDESQLPVILPPVKDFDALKPDPSQTDPQPVLEKLHDWVEVRGEILPNGCAVVRDGGSRLFHRETNTMPQWAGSSWYWMRFMDPHNTQSFCETYTHWGPVDIYVGGAEHAVLHLLYARFWHKVLYDLGYVADKEPFKKLVNQGLIMAEDGQKMSKSLGNVVNPDDIIERFGADTLRMYEMFMGPFENNVAWSTASIQGVRKLLDRIYALRTQIQPNDKPELDISLHTLLKQLHHDIVAFKFNTCISAYMIFQNAVDSCGTIGKSQMELYVRSLAPFAPHLAEEIWHLLGHTDSIHTQQYPVYDDTKLSNHAQTIPVQINGKVRGTVKVASDITEPTLREVVLQQDFVRKWIAKQEIKKWIIVSGRVINIIV